ASSSGSPCHAGNGGYCREVPDVSADADPYTGYMIYYNGAGSVSDGPTGWLSVGGTSAAAPLWAALIALSNASSTCSGSPIGFLNPVLYRIAGSGYTSTFNDIISGNNNYTGAGGFSAGAGYDMASGLGTPNGSALSRGLCDKVTLSDPGAQASIAGKAASLALRAASSGGFGLAYAATGLPAGLSINPSTGVISGTPTTIGSSTMIVTARDGSGATGSATFGWTVVAPTVTTRNPGNQTSTVGKPVSLSIVATVNNGRAPTYSVSGLPHGLSINAQTGLISGTPRAAGRSTVTVRATDASGASSAATFSWTVGGLPSASRTSLRGIAKNVPTLSFALAAGTDAPRIETIAVGLPGGMRFSSSARVLGKRIIVKGPGGRRLRFTAKVRRGALTIRLASPVAKLQVTIAAPALGATRTFATAVARRRIRSLHVVVKPTDSAGNTTRLVLKIRAS
ncbi:MAG: putative Ig domain-containing protein, partial [Solirubrobacteraceae bacterium]